MGPCSSERGPSTVFGLAASAPTHSIRGRLRARFAPDRLNWDDRARGHKTLTESAETTPDLGPEPGWIPDNPLVALRAERNFVHGDPDGDRIRIRYYREEGRRALMAKVWLGPEAEGPPGHAHGGVLLAVLDEVLGGSCWAHGYKVVLARFESDMRAPVRLRHVVIVDGEIESVDGRKIWVRGRIVDPDGTLHVESRCLFVQLTDAQRAGYLEHSPIGHDD